MPMDISDYQSLDAAALREAIRSLNRPQLDEQIRQFGAQHALLCQRLEALYAPDRMEQFMALRPGGLDEIDKAIALSKDNPKEFTLLKSFRELNRVLLPFMDVYEERVLQDLTYMSKEELEAMYAGVTAHMASAEKLQKQHPEDYRQAQNSSGTLRLAKLMKDGIRKELKDRFVAEAE
jgi:hypothetical protein